MKKFLLLLLVIAMSFSLFACSAQDQNDNDAQQTDNDTSENTSTQEDGEEDVVDEYAPIYVDNENFTLSYDKTEFVTDEDGDPAALIYFTFTNKTEQALSMVDVFWPTVFQDGIECDTWANLYDYPDEFDNRDRELKDGATIQLCISFALFNDTSELELVINDQYETFMDIASQKIAR